MEGRRSRLVCEAVCVEVSCALFIKKAPVWADAPLIPALLYAGFCPPHHSVEGCGEMIISLGRRLPAASSGGVTGPTEPSEIPATQILLA